MTYAVSVGARVTGRRRWGFDGRLSIDAGGIVLRHAEGSVELEAPAADLRMWARRSTSPCWLMRDDDRFVICGKPAPTVFNTNPYGGWALWNDRRSANSWVQLALVGAGVPVLEAKPRS